MVLSVQRLAIKHTKPKPLARHLRRDEHEHQGRPVPILISQLPKVEAPMLPYLCVVQGHGRRHFKENVPVRPLSRAQQRPLCHPGRSIDRLERKLQR